MSEYQYYEFLAIDRPLSTEDTRWLRSLSTRAHITATGFTNTYHWGDFSGDPIKLMKRCFDAHVYVSNFGYCRFIVKVPTEAVDLALLKAYCGECGVAVSEAVDNLLVDFSIEGEPGDWEMHDDGSGLMAPLSMLRSELLDGDYRCMYLAWLLNVQQKTLDDDEHEPPVPAGLSKLPASCETLAEFLQLDPLLVALAAEASPPREASALEQAEIRTWIQGLPQQEQQDLLLRFITDDDARIRHTLLRRMRVETAANSPKRPSGTGAPARTVGELIATWETRVRAAEEGAAAARTSKRAPRKAK